MAAQDATGAEAGTAGQVSFWKARIFQALLVFMGGVLLLQPLRALVYFIISGEIFDFRTSLWAVFAVAFETDARNLAVVIGVALGLSIRSATWGSLSFISVLVTAGLVACMVDGGARLAVLWQGLTMAQAGFGGGTSFIWVISWLAAACGFYVAMVYIGLNRRYKVEERENIRYAFWGTVVFAIYCPVVYGLVYLRAVFGDELALLISRYGVLSVRGAYIPLMVAGMAGFLLVAHLRRSGMVSGRFLFCMFFAVCGFFYGLQVMDEPELWRLYLVVYGVFAVICAGIGWIILRFLGVPGESPVFSTCIVALERRAGWFFPRFGLWVFCVAGCVAPFFWHCLVMLLRAVLFGFPPVAFFFSAIGWDYLDVVLFFAAPLGIYAVCRGRMDFTVLFVCGGVACVPGMIGGGQDYGVSLGWYCDYLAWPMLVYAGVCILCWGVLAGFVRVARLVQRPLSFVKM